jgi:hypothetical protein
MTIKRVISSSMGPLGDNHGGEKKRTCTIFILGRNICFPSISLYEEITIIFHPKYFQ